MGTLVEHALPDYILIENVPGFRKDNPHRTVFLELLEGNGY